MVREQAPSMAPQVPAQRRSTSTTSNRGNDKSNPIGVDEPQFGVPSPLRPLRQSFSTRPQTLAPSSQSALNPVPADPLYDPAANQSFHPLAPKSTSENLPSQPAKSHDGYSNLFISSKKKTGRPTANPLLQAVDSMRGQTQPQTSLASGSDKVVKISPPQMQPAFSSRPAKPLPMFCSQPILPTPSSNVIDLTLGQQVGMSTNGGLYQDQFGAADHYTYMDSKKTTDDIKALLEGAFEDEDEKPRTRQRKNRMQESLEARLENVTIEGAGKEDQVEVNLEEDDVEEDASRVEGLKIKLLPHQIDGVAWMQDKELGTHKTRGVFPKGGILADDMGLGKTIQSIALMLKNPRPASLVTADAEAAASQRKVPEDVSKGTLVVAPLALIKQWEAEIRDRVEESHRLRVCVHHGPKRTRRYQDLRKYDVVITTYHTLVSEHGSCSENLRVGSFGLTWYRVILDEAHSIKNRNAKATKAACALKAEYRWCLTGTPMQNNLDELQSLIHFLRIKPYENLNAWRDQITGPMNSGRGRLAIKRLQVYLKAFMKRRTKDVLKQEGALRTEPSKDAEQGSQGFKIVKRTIENVEAEFTPEERGFYDKLESRTDKSLEQMMAGNQMSYASALVLLLRLRQSCNHVDLVKGDLAKEKDMFMNGSGGGAGSQNPGRKKAGKGEDLDSITSMLGGLSVATKRCDMCQSELPYKESSAGAIRCADCEANLAAHETKMRLARERKKRNNKSSTSHAKRGPAKRRPRRNLISDSDDDDDDDERQEDEEEEEAAEAVNRGREQRDNEPTSEAKEATSSDDGDGDLTSDESDDDDNHNPPSPILSTKIRRLLQLLHKDCRRHKYIIFSFFTSMLDLIEPFLRRDGLVYTRYDGQMKNDAREASLERLRTHDETRILLCSLRAGSLGLNLTAASRVVILEPFWNPFVEEQAIDRVHRLNQTVDVVVHKLTIKDTVEARILDLQERKRRLADATIQGGSSGGGGAGAGAGAGGGTVAANKLTMEDMLSLFKHDADPGLEGENGLEMEGGLEGVGGIGERRGGDVVGEEDKEEEEEGGGRNREEKKIVKKGVGEKVKKKKKKSHGHDDEHAVYGRRW